MDRTRAAAWIASVATILGVLVALYRAGESDMPPQFWVFAAIGFLAPATIAWVLFAPERGLARGTFAASHVIIAAIGLASLYSLLRAVFAANLPTTFLPSMIGGTLTSIPIAWCAMWWAIAPRPTAALVTRMVFAASIALRTSGMILGVVSPYGGETPWAYAVYFLSFAPALALVVGLPAVSREPPTSL